MGFEAAKSANFFEVEVGVYKIFFEFGEKNFPLFVEGYLQGNHDIVVDAAKDILFDGKLFGDLLISEGEVFADHVTYLEFFIEAALQMGEVFDEQDSEDIGQFSRGNVRFLGYLENAQPFENKHITKKLFVKPVKPRMEGVDPGFRSGIVESLVDLAEG